MKKFVITLLFITFLIACKSANEEHAIKKYPLGYNEPVKGVWLTNVASEALYSKKNIINTVNYCQKLGINTIFVVTWNKAMTTYRSKIMKNFTGIEIDPVLDPLDTGRDPLKELIEEAHHKNIKVIAWFEFGFSSSYNENGGKIVELKPEWASLTSDQKLTTKNNFDWLNALDSEVQSFISSLIFEVIENYDIDGIQGDDRLPAMPSSGGYNAAVIKDYQKENNNQLPPKNYKDSIWVDWRAKKLNSYLKILYNQIKEIDPDCIVSMAPSVYPWSKTEYLQDWPQWINDGYVDMICPQVYRKDSSSYLTTLVQNLELVNTDKRHLFYPGVLIQVNDINPSKDLFNYMIQTNRHHNISGEVFFFYEGLFQFEDEIKNHYLQ